MSDKVLLENLFDPELVDKLNAYNKQRDIAISEFKASWRNSELNTEEAHLSLSSHLLLLLTKYPIIEIKANKTALNKVINWSSSKFNEYKKSEFIALVLSEHSRGSIKYSSSSFTAGSYGAGATGDARSSYGTKGTGGEFEVIYYGFNTYIFDGKVVFSFVSNSEFIAKPSLSLSCVKFKNKLASASKAFDSLWPVKDLDSEFNS